MIYLVSLYYPPVSNPPSNRMQHMARVLVGEYGAENVTVVTGRPNYPAGKLAAEDRWRLCRREKGQWGETVMHLYEIPAPFQGLYLKTLGQVSFAVSFAFFLLFRRYRPGDVVFITSGPIFQVYVAWIMSKVRRGLRYVMDIRDLWPQTVAGLGHMKEDSTAFRILKSWTDRAHRSAFASVGVVEGIHDYIREVAPDRPAHLIYNPVDTDLFVPDSEASVGAFRQQHPELFGDSSKTVFLYAGVHSHAIDLVTMMRAVVQLAAMRSDFVFLVIGYGEETDSIRAIADEHGLSGSVVHFLPYMAREGLRKYICAADFCYSSTSSKPIYRMVIPTKMSEYMACNKFVVAVHDCSFADRAARSGNAVVAPPGDVAAIAGVLQDVIENRAHYLAEVTARDYILEHHSIARFDERVRRLFASLV